MLIYTLKNQSEFNIVSQQSQKFYSDSFLIIYNKALPTNFYSNVQAIFVGTKVSKKLGKAVVRNKIKRRLRHLIRITLSQSTLNRVGLILIPKKGFEKVKFLDLQKAFERIILHTLNN